MNETRVRYRNKLSHSIYKYFLKPVLFRRDPEDVHDNMTQAGIMLGKYKLTRKVVSGLFNYQNPILSQKVLGIFFKNPIGLSAGFDKDAKLTDILPSVGFGFAEIGSVTGLECAGNPKPRLWRLPESKSLVVYYGLKNDGCEKISKRLSNKHFEIPIGISVAMTNCSENLNTEKAVEDYAHAFRKMENSGDYITINISCPNALGGQPFTSPKNLRLLMQTLNKIPTKRPVFLKLSPDMTRTQIDEILSIADQYKINGIICSNLTKKADKFATFGAKPEHKGGLSGKAVEDLSNDLLAYIFKKEGRKFVLVGSGGVSSAEDAYKKIRLGASLIQLITGMIYEGPQVISEINRGLAKLLKNDGFKNISQAIGVDNINS